MNRPPQTPPVSFQNGKGTSGSGLIVEDDGSVHNGVGCSGSGLIVEDDGSMNNAVGCSGSGLIVEDDGSMNNAVGCSGSGLIVEDDSDSASANPSREGVDLVSKALEHGAVVHALENTDDGPT